MTGKLTRLKNGRFKSVIKDEGARRRDSGYSGCEDASQLVKLEAKVSYPISFVNVFSLHY
jgi:hypothetical protein